MQKAVNPNLFNSTAAAKHSNQNYKILAVCGSMDINLKIYIYLTASYENEELKQFIFGTVNLVQIFDELKVFFPSFVVSEPT